MVQRSHVGWHLVIFVPGIVCRVEQQRPHPEPDHPPTNKKTKYFLNPELALSPDAWLKHATTMNGSWWGLWQSWSSERSGRKRPAPTTLGSERYKPMEPAPGIYVLES
jgi:polyhydroxyalkanoate synthase subunit PhaC